MERKAERPPPLPCPHHNRPCPCHTHATHMQTLSQAIRKTNHRGQEMDGQQSHKAQNLEKTWCGELSIEQSPSACSTLPPTPGPLCPPFLGLGPRIIPLRGPPWWPIITRDGCLRAAQSRASGPLRGEPCPAVASLRAPWPGRATTLPTGSACSSLSPLLTAPAPGRGGTVPAGCR